MLIVLHTLSFYYAIKPFLLSNEIIVNGGMAVSRYQEIEVKVLT